MTQTQNRKKIAHSSVNCTIKDRNELKDINLTLKELVSEINSLRKALDDSKTEINTVKVENLRLKQIVNINLYKIDDLEQYRRRENMQIHGIPESTDSVDDDGEKVILKMAKDLNIELKDSDIQRAHQLGRKRINPNSRPRPIIIRFVSSKKRNEFFFAKSKLRNLKQYENTFISEDLITLKSCLLNYVKNECDDNFVLCHTRNGKIRTKRSARKRKLKEKNEKDFGIGNWLVISMVDDLFSHGIDVNLAKLDYKPLLINNENCELKMLKQR